MTIDENFESKLLEKIKEEKINPTPRWQFLLKDYVIWILGALLLLIGSLSFSVLIYLFKNNDWDVYEKLSGNFLQFILLTLPYFWILFLALFVFILDYNIRHTRRGYKYPLTIIVLASVFSSAFLGFLFYGLGFGEQLDYVLGRQMPFYEKFMNPRIGMWENPRDGRISGVVVEKIEPEIFRMMNRMQEEWIIDLSEANLPPGYFIEIGKPIKMTGKITGEQVFAVDMIFPPGPGRGIFERFYERKIPMYMKNKKTSPFIH